jgi:hypothetical protein
VNVTILQAASSSQARVGADDVLSSGRRVAMRVVRTSVALVAAVMAAGCAVPEPWVKPYERERLADPIMQWQGDLLAAKHSQHVRDIREGARGANGVQGGGCGCK